MKELPASKVEARYGGLRSAAVARGCNYDGALQSSVGAEIALGTKLRRKG
jgi:hypothetical protein